MERIFVARGVVALAFAAFVLLAVAMSLDHAARIFAGYSILDGLLAIAAGYRALRNWNNPGRSALFAEGLIACAAGVVIGIHDQNATAIAFAIGANAIIGGALASVYAMNPQSEYRADWWAVFGILGLFLGFGVTALLAFGIPAMLIAAGVVAAVQGIARLMLRDKPGQKSIEIGE